MYKLIIALKQRIDRSYFNISREIWEFQLFQIKHLNIKIYSCGLNKNKYAQTTAIFKIVVETTLHACLISICLLSFQNCMQCVSFMKKPLSFSLWKVINEIIICFHFYRDNKLSDMGICWRRCRGAGVGYDYNDSCVFCSQTIHMYLYI